MKEWKEVTKLPFRAKHFFENIIAEEEGNFWKQFHKERGHFLECIPTWSEFELMGDQQEDLGKHVRLYSPDLYDFKASDHQWLYRVDKFRLPVPLPKAVSKYLFRGNIPENGHLVHNTVVRPQSSIEEDVYVMEVISVPQEGLLADKFIVHLIYHVKQDPDNAEHCVFEFTGRLSVQRLPPITSAVETFAVPFSKSVQRQWTDIMQRSRVILTPSAQKLSFGSVNMGLLSKGTPMPWEKAREHADHVRYNGIDQFLYIYHSVKDRERDCLLWGDELEYVMVKFDHDKKEAKLDLRAADILSELESEEKKAISERGEFETSWKPEYARYMIEATPGSPYRTIAKNLLSVEDNMKLRRKTAEKYLKEGEYLFSITNFPMLGVQGCFEPNYEPKGPASHSMFIPDEAIAPHARFPTLTRNIRTRRGKKVAINVPIFRDKQTPRPFIESFPEPPFPEDGAQDAKPDHIYMDCMCFGMGCCCLQITMQACNINEARHLYDQLAVMTPIMLALTAATPIFRGYLADVDCRWDIISASVDDRTAEEMGEKPLEKNKFVIKKSRYDSIDMFISNDRLFKKKYNDLNPAFDKEIQQKLVKNGVDELLATHFAHLFIRDPLVIYQELLDQENHRSSDHFENIQSTNWQTMRFKPPPPNSHIGWRVEFRSMEIQFTDFENAAFAIFIVLLTRVIQSFGMNLYIPLSKVDENMKIAQRRDAVLTRKFWFRKHVVSQSYEQMLDSSPMDQCVDRSRFNANRRNSVDDDDEFLEMSINEIINGKQGEFVGLIPLIEAYLDAKNVVGDEKKKLMNYMNLIRKRASGELMTNAMWIRDFVRKHPQYKQDSKITQEINYDLLVAIKEISEGNSKPSELF